MLLVGLGILLFTVNITCGKMKIDSINRAPEPNWYKKSFIHSHMSVGFEKSNIPEFKKQVSTVKPDAIQFHSGHENAKVFSKNLGFHRVMTINRAGSWRREYDKDPKNYIARIDTNGKISGRKHRGVMQKHLCVNSPGVERFIVPEYAKAAKMYRPSQIWIDENIVCVNLCYCQYCLKRFEKEYGLKPPINAVDANWEQWTKFHRDCFVDWTRKIATAIKEEDKNIIVTFKHSFFVCQPEPVPEYVTNLSADIHSRPLVLGFYSRYGTTCGVPFDLMPGLCSDTWAGTCPKLLAQIKEDVAIITANGGRWNIGEFPSFDNRKEKTIPYKGLHQLALKGVEFARARKQWTFQTTSVPYAAILTSSTTHYSHVIPDLNQSKGKAGDKILTCAGTWETVRPESDPGPKRVYWTNNRFAADEIIGTYSALLENHVHHDIINEFTLAERLDEYQLLIIPEQYKLSDKVIRQIRDFVRQGGKVIATGRSLRGKMAEVIGAKVTREMKIIEPSITIGNQKISLYAGNEIELTTAEVLYKFDGMRELPAVTINKFGDGAVIYIAANFFDLYYDNTPYRKKATDNSEPLRTFAASLIDTAMSEKSIDIKAPAWVEITLRQKKGDMLIQVVDRAIEFDGAEKGSGSVIVDMKTEIAPLSITLQPEGKKLEKSWKRGITHFELPMHMVDIHGIIKLKDIHPRRKKEVGYRVADAAYRIFGTQNDWR